MNALDGLFALRPLLWIPAIALFEAGRLEAGGPRWPSWSSLPPLLCLMALLGAVHLANGWRDREGDRRNRKGGAVASGTLSARDVTRLAAGSLFVAIVVAGASSVSGPALVLLGAALLLGAAYTVPPLEWKRRPGLDLFAQGAGYGVVAFLIGAASSNAPNAFAPTLLVASLPYAGGIVTVGLVTMLADREGDVAAGQRTSTVAWGARRSAAAAVVAAILTAALGLALRSWIPSLWGILATGVLLLAPLSAARAGGARPSPAEGRRAWNRMAIALQLAYLALLAARSPFALLAALLIGMASAAWDRSRGGGGYPLAAAWNGNRRGSGGCGRGAG